MAKANKSSQGTTILEFDIDAIRAREQAVAQETDDEIITRLTERFKVLDNMTQIGRAHV